MYKYIVNLSVDLGTKDINEEIPIWHSYNVKGEQVSHHGRVVCLSLSENYFHRYYLYRYVCNVQIMNVTDTPNVQ